jgi:hypothetical protein
MQELRSLIYSFRWPRHLSGVRVRRQIVAVAKRLECVRLHLPAQFFFPRMRPATTPSRNGRLDNDGIHQAGWERFWIGQVEPKHIELRARAKSVVNSGFFFGKINKLKF